MGKIINEKQLKRNLKDWLKVLVLLLDEATVIVLVILALQYFRVQIPLPITIFISVVVAILVFMVHLAVIPSFRRKQITGREGMIGIQCKVVKPLKPTGIIMVMGEHWKARTLGENIEADEDVEIIAITGLILTVTRLDAPEPILHV